MENNRDMKRLFTTYAKVLGDYSIVSKNDLANGYCKAVDDGDENMRSAYYSAIVIRYWNKLATLKAKNPVHLTDEICFDILNHGIQYALDHRAWLTEGNLVYKDPNGPDKVINRCIDSSYLIWMQQNNKLVRKANAGVYSLDARIDDNSDCALDSTGAVTVETITGAQDLIGRFLKDGRVIEALILDGMAYHDAFSYETETKEFEYEDEEGQLIKGSYDYDDATFVERKLVKHLNSINQKFMKTYFDSTYNLTVRQGNKILKELKSYNNAKLYKAIRATIIRIQQSKELASFLK